MVTWRIADGGHYLAMEDPTPYLGISDTHRAGSGDAALAQRLAELGEVVRPGPAHAPDPGPDVGPAKTNCADPENISD